MVDILWIWAMMIMRCIIINVNMVGRDCQNANPFVLLATGRTQLWSFSFLCKNNPIFEKSNIRKNAYGKMAMATTATTLCGRAYWCSSVSIRILPCEHQDAPVWACWCSCVSNVMLLFCHPHAPIWASGCSHVTIWMLQREHLWVYEHILCLRNSAQPRASWCSRVSILMLPCEHLDAPVWASWCCILMLPCERPHAHPWCACWC